jgi:hypothetical protein
MLVSGLFENPFAARSLAHEAGLHINRLLLKVK